MFGRECYLVLGSYAPIYTVLPISWDKLKPLSHLLLLKTTDGRNIGSKTKPYPPIMESRLGMVEVLLEHKPLCNINLPQTGSVTSK